MHWYCNKYILCVLSLLNEVSVKSISNIICRVKAAAEQIFNLLNKVNVDNKLYQNKQVIKKQMETQAYSSNEYVGHLRKTEQKQRRPSLNPICLIRYVFQMLYES